MLTNSLAPIKRAMLFFGFMGASVATLTFGAALQTPTDLSSASVAQAKIERHLPTDTQLASVNPAERAASSARRAIGTSQQARLTAPTAVFVR